MFLGNWEGVTAPPPSLQNGPPGPHPPMVERRENNLRVTGYENYGTPVFGFTLKHPRGGFQKIREPLLGPLFVTSRPTLLIRKGFSK